MVVLELESLRSKDEIGSSGEKGPLPHRARARLHVWKRTVLSLAQRTHSLGHHSSHPPQWESVESERHAKNSSGSRSDW